MSKEDRRPHPLWLRIVIAVPLGAVMAALFMMVGGDLFGAASLYVWIGVSLLATIVLVRLGTRIGKLFTAFFEMLSGV